jgi:signal recognition particle subunit SRP68
MSKTGDQQPADMEVESSTVAEEKPAVRFSINGELYHP